MLFLKKDISHNKTEKCKIKSVKIAGITFSWCCKILINLDYIKLVPANLMLGLTLGWTSTPLREGGGEILLLMFWKPNPIKLRLDEPLGLNADFFTSGKVLQVSTFVVEPVILSLYVGYGEIKLDQNIIKLFIKSAVFSLLTCPISSAFLPTILSRYIMELSVCKLEEHFNRLF